jgi:hypothetical protein
MNSDEQQHLLRDGMPDTSAADTYKIGFKAPGSISSTMNSIKCCTHALAGCVKQLPTGTIVFIVLHPAGTSGSSLLSVVVVVVGTTFMPPEVEADALACSQ